MAEVESTDGIEAVRLSRDSTSLACRNIISRAFSPYVSVAASQDTDDLCRDMGFESLLDLLRPFGDTVSGRVTVRDSQAMSVSFDDFGIRFSPTVSAELPAASGEYPLSSSPSSVTAHQLPQLLNVDDLEQYILDRLEDFRKTGVDTSPYIAQELYLDFFKHILASDVVNSFETFSHPVAGVIAISSRNTHPIDTLSALYKQSHDPQIPEYINRDYLRYYVLVHDEHEGDLDKSIALFEKMKRHFGLHCHMIRLRRPVDGEVAAISVNHTEWKTLTESMMNDQPLLSLHEEDANSLRMFTRELVVQSLVPFMERCIATWNDQVASSRRGLAGRFFSASKKYFATSTRATTSILSAGAFGQSNTFPFSLSASSSPSPASSRSPTPPGQPVTRGNYNASRLSYSYLTPEAQLRKLADFAFMLRDYKLAYNTYELLKKDYHNDKAWPYLAASQEMAAVSFLMYSETLPTKSRLDLIDPLLDSAIYSYISRCSLPTYALRCVLLSSELLCTLNTPSAASEGATKWILKALNERLVGRLGYAMLMERISGAFASYDEIAKRVHEKQLLRSSPSPSVTPTTSSTSVNSSTSKRDKEDKVPSRTSRHRKSAFWQLLAAREWSYANQTERSVYCAEQANTAVYQDLAWAQPPTGLLGRLKEASYMGTGAGTR
jgi:hypothetical protein